MIPEREVPDDQETKELPPEELEPAAGAREGAGGDAAPETDPEEEPAAEEEVDDDTAEETAAAWKDRYLRVLAEQQNFRKRMQREREQDRLYAEETLILELLPALDAIRLATRAGGGADAIREGVRLAQRDLLRLLGDRGLEPIEAVGLPFDPRLHEAVATIPDPQQAPNTVIEEIAKGYTFQGRVLRASKVHVAVAPPKAAPAPAEETG
ncbi:MAG: nucleotide exchange factor GrpE, partial [Planctomycetota bacterium]